MEFITSNKVFIKSKRTVTSIWKKYLYASIMILLYQIIYNLITKNFNNIINILKYEFLVVIISLCLELMLNLIFREKELKKIFKILPIAILLGLFLLDIGIIPITIIVFITLLIRKIFKNIELSSLLFGLLLLFIYKTYFLDNITIIEIESFKDILLYLLGKYSISPILMIIIFCYLFKNKSIKYNIVLSSLIIILLITVYNLLNDIFLIPTNLLFYLIMCLPDMGVTPDIKEGQIIYGIITSLIIFIFYLFIPSVNISTIVAILISEIFLVKVINKISYKMKLKRLV